MIGIKKARGAAALSERVAFDEPTGGADPFGGAVAAWTERHVCAAEWLYGRGDEQVQAARNAGRKAYKLRIRSSSVARSITEAYRLRDVRRGLPLGVQGDTLPGNRWNIVEIDAVTDRHFIYLTVEGPQA